MSNPGARPGHRRYLIAAGLLLPIAALLLWPVAGSDRWDINANQTLLDGKASYLESLRNVRSGRRMPNIVLILADDLGRHDVSFLGDDTFPTPRLDALARESVVYPNAYASAAICAPSRAALITGRVQNRFGFESQPMQRYVRNLGEYLGFRYLIDTDEMQPFLLDSYPGPAQMTQQGLPEEEITLADVYAALGYRTGLFGKWHLGYATTNHPRRFGFAEQYGFMEAFSLYSEPGAPDIVEHHHDLFWEAHIWSMARSGPSAITRNGAVIEETRYLTDAIAEEASAFMDAALDAEQPFFAFLPFSAPHTPFQAPTADYQASSAELDHNTRVYAAMIRRLDTVVGNLVDHLRRRGALDNTIIVFTSDNGGAAYTDATSNGPLRGGKFTQFEGGLAVPLLVRWPEGETGSDPRVVLLTDLYATLLDASALPLPEDRAYDSVSLRSAAGDRRLFWRSDFNLAVRWQSWKLHKDRRAGTTALYDLAVDPGEANNLAAVHPEVVAQMLAALDRWEAELDAPRWPRVMNYRYQDAAGEYWFAI